MKSSIHSVALAVAWIALLGSASSAGGMPQAKVSESTHYYKISGRTVDELVEQMRQKGPTDGGGGHWFAYTKWYIHWKYDYKRGASTCTLGSVRVTVSVVFTLPAWDMPRDVPSAVRMKWGKFLNGLAIHENGHKAIALEAAKKILERISSLGPRADCEELDHRAGSLGQKLVQDARERETRYDRETNHGETQGATLRN